jgi:hypothetical protein
LVRADVRLWQTERANLAAGQAELSAFVSQVSSGCPSALMGAPTSPAALVVAFEVGVDLRLAVEQPDKRALLAFSSSVARLRWRDRGAAKTVSALARVRRVRARLYEPPAQLCGHLLALKASNFQTTPLGSIQFVMSVNAVAKLVKQAESGAPLLLTPSDNRRAQRTFKLQTRVENAQRAAALAAAKQVVSVLGASGGLA